MVKQPKYYVYLTVVLFVSYFPYNMASADQISEHQNSGNIHKMPERAFKESVSNVNVSNKIVIEEWVKRYNVDGEEISSDLPEAVLVGNTEVKFKYETNESGIQRIISVIEDLDLEIVLENDGISVVVESSDDSEEETLFQQRSVTGARADQNILQRTIHQISDKTEKTISAENQEAKPPFLDPTIVKNFISKITDEKTLKRLEEEIDNLKKSGEREREMLQKLEKHYSGFEIELDLKNLSPYFRENEKTDNSITRVEKLIGLIKQRKINLSFEKQEEILAGYDTLNETVGPMIDQYMTELRNTQNFASRINNIFETSTSKVYIRYDLEKISVFINLKRETPPVNTKGKYEAEAQGIQ